MIDKISGYLQDALKKMVSLCAVILDPTFKTNYWTKNHVFIQENYNLSVKKITKTFTLVTLKFEKEHKDQSKENDSSCNNPSEEPQPSSSKSFLEVMYNEDGDEVEPLVGVLAKINQYLKDATKPHQTTNILTYWANHQHNFPILSKMAGKYLAIPATNASLERVFSKVFFPGSDPPLSQEVSSSLFF
ncbi:hypothetical protein PCASD_24802 [Puccinia coronata f. sp. avenae]|uniref:HAT C-terminal dimerisation domain-containing protein n=2 Tax=Puccinia coronata f. sp. avenae TaxID=200324 RepID=A0A2N5S4A7_9BASI|nr:hypothetical protein PCASD_24802 [Puccinia coronata f. sp. avenae]